MFELHIFSASGFAAAHMSFLLVLFQNAPDLSIKPWVDGLEAIGHVFMYGGFADSEFGCRTPNGVLAFYNIFAELDGSFFHDAFQKDFPPFLSILVSII